MNNMDMVELIKDIKEQKEITSELLNTLIGLTSILSSFSQAQKEIKAIKEDTTLIGCLDSLNDINLQMKEVIENYQESNNKIKRELQVNKNAVDLLSIDFDTHQNRIIDIFARNIEILDTMKSIMKNSEIVKYRTKEVTEVLDNDIKLKIEYLGEKLSTLIHNLDSTSKNINSSIGYIGNLVEKWDGLNNTLSENFIEYNKMINECHINIVKSNENLGYEIREMVAINGNLYVLLSGMKKREEDMYEEFSKFLDKWADDNLYSVAIKKRKNI